ncbi:MAG: branched-chain amino acid ABC transporter permease [Lachnospiraceae bacterium]|jgi:branched-chain amino acid transport system permease protein|nr:branched-chain amino acid ABC transporter permease [Lachnospiraceae bacterium]MBQ2022109.1 branched-chain amino acid ABC transporter permease [Lachnospiraceae bacterium]MBQ2106695.1 branched-chain amino acid ABC transporter permease [Lachnospiraceae bacterium]MBQ2401683.1 branched-chain amino acid ABC transporter permease [Lachnospiraceae bacterium]MBQ2404521.1 branched-chain amino acid ABC transporter permease [Lachnospiraceae bacterium]
MELIFSTVINGLSLGGIYAMIALGYTMVYGIAKLLNFAHGDIIMVGGYIIYVFLATKNPILAIVMAVIGCVILGICIEKVAYKPLRGASPLAVLITAIGVSNLLQSLAQIIFGSAPKMATVYDFGVIKMFGATIQISSLVTLGVTFVVMVALTMFVKYTRIGRAMIAVSEDRSAAQLMGINVNSIITITFAIGSALAALAGMFYLLKAPSVSSTLGAMPGIKAFTAAVIGGIGSIPGAMLGGILLGMIESISYKITAIAPYTDAIEFSILILILLVKPNGFLGKKRREKV